MLLKKHVVRHKYDIDLFISLHFIGWLVLIANFSSIRAKSWREQMLY